jgi:hypothetical protein
VESNQTSRITHPHGFVRNDNCARWHVPARRSLNGYWLKCGKILDGSIDEASEVDASSLCKRCAKNASRELVALKG